MAACVSEIGGLKLEIFHADSVVGAISSADVVELFGVAEVSFDEVGGALIRGEAFLFDGDDLFLFECFLEDDFGIEKHEANFLFRFVPLLQQTP